ncbi:MAG: hypothetical protein KTR32_00135 [Granulosicoccus sp.]|nr:hypothetical protein [Granulosicoccus sp.]
MDKKKLNDIEGKPSPHEPRDQPRDQPPDKTTDQTDVPTKPYPPPIRVIVEGRKTIVQRRDH